LEGRTSGEKLQSSLDRLLDQWIALYERAAFKITARSLTPAQQRYLIHLAQAWHRPRRWTILEYKFDFDHFHIIGG